MRPYSSTLGRGTAGTLGMDFTHTFATFDDLKIMDLIIVYLVRENDAQDNIHGFSRDA
jgi:hypothetical protein